MTLRYFLGSPLLSITTHCSSRITHIPPPLVHALGKESFLAIWAQQRSLPQLADIHDLRYIAGRNWETGHSKRTNVEPTGDSRAGD